MNMFNSNAQRNTMLMVIIVLCTLTIIWTNYMFTQSMVTDISDKLMENEYKKIWWKENYMIMQEIQRREILWYLDNIKNEKPELIKEILEKQNDNSSDALDSNVLTDLKKDTFIKWSTWALVSVIEFSDMECEFCKTQHTNWIIDKLLEKNKENLNYSFKNFPLPAHKNAQKEAEAAKCVENLSWWDKYLEYIATVFTDTKSGWEWYNLEDLSTLAEKMWVDKMKFDDCLNNNLTKTKVEKEFVQGRMLWIKSVPTSLIINNNTWKYQIVSEVIDEATLNSIIEEVSK